MRSTGAHRTKGLFFQLSSGFLVLFSLTIRKFVQEFPAIQANLLIAPVSLCYLLFLSPPFLARPHVLSLAHLLHYQSLGLV